MPDSEFLQSIEAQIDGDYSSFLKLDHKNLEPFGMMHEKGMLNHILKPQHKGQPVCKL